jgi:hypothetical protein
MAPEDLSTERLLLLATGADWPTREEQEACGWPGYKSPTPMMLNNIARVACRILAARIDKARGAA